MILSKHLVVEVMRQIESKQNKGYDEKLYSFLYEVTEVFYGAYGVDGGYRDVILPDEHLVDIMDIWAAFRIILIKDLAEISNEMWEGMIQLCRFASPFGKPGNASLGMNWVQKVAEIYRDQAAEHATEIAEYYLESHLELLQYAANWQKLVDIFNRDNG